MKRTVIPIAAAILVLVALVAAAPLLLPTAVLKSAIADRISALMGRTVTINGETDLTLLPRPTVAVEHIAIDAPDDKGSDPFLTVDRLEARLRVLPLLIGRLEFDTFELTAPRLHLVVDADKKANWSMADSALAIAARDPSAAAIGVGRIMVTNGTVLYDNRTNASRDEMTGVALDLTWRSAEQAASGHGTMSWRGETFEFNGLVAQPLALLRGQQSAVRLALASTPLRLAFTGNAFADAGFTLDGQAMISTPSLRRTIEWLGTPMGTGAILGAAAIKGEASWSGGVLSFDKAEVELDGNSAAGTLTLDTAGERPSLKGSLTTEKLDISPYLEATRADLNAAGSWLLAPARLDFARTLDAEIRLTSDLTVASALRIGKADAALTMKGGTLGFAVSEAPLYGGTLGMILGARESDGLLTAQAEFSLADVAAGNALRDMTGETPFDGSTTATITVSGQGKSWGALAHNLAGTAQVSIADGTIAGFDLPELAQRLADPLAEPVEPASVNTPFKSMTADLAIGEGRISTSDLTLVGDDVKLTLSGEGSLVSGSLEASATLAVGTTDTPLSVGGTWQAAKVGRAAPAANQP